MRLHRLRPDDPLSWGLMPRVLWRVRRFCEQYDPHTNPAVLQLNVGQGFTAPITNYVVVAILDEQDQVAGHMLATIEPWTGKTFIVILQLEVDNDQRITPALYREGMALLRAIAADTKAHYIQLLAYAEDGIGDLRRARLFRRLGFAPVGMTMRLALDAPVPGDGATPAKGSEDSKLDPDAGNLDAGEVLH